MVKPIAPDEQCLAEGYEVLLTARTPLAEVRQDLCVKLGVPEDVVTLMNEGQEVDETKTLTENNVILPGPMAMRQRQRPLLRYGFVQEFLDREKRREKSCLLPGIPSSFAEELSQRSGFRRGGVQDIPAVNAGSDATAAAALFKDKGIVVVLRALTGEALMGLRATSDIVMDDIVRHDPEGLGSRGPKRYSFGGSSSTGSQLHHKEWAVLVDVPAVTAILDEIWASQDYACFTTGGDFCLAGAPGHQNLHADAWFEGCEDAEVPRSSA